MLIWTTRILFSHLMNSEQCVNNQISFKLCYAFKMSFLALILLDRTQLLGTIKVKGGCFHEFCTRKLCVYIFKLCTPQEGAETESNNSHLVTTSLTKQHDGPVFLIWWHLLARQLRGPSGHGSLFRLICPFPRTDCVGIQQVLSDHSLMVDMNRGISYYLPRQTRGQCVIH